MILLSWFYAKILSPFVPKSDQPVHFSYKFASITIHESPLYLGILMMILMVTQCFWKTSVFYMFTQVFEKGLLYEDVKFLEIQYKNKRLPITHRAFNIILLLMNIYFSTYFYYYAAVQSIIYLMKTYPEYWFHYYQALVIVVMRYWDMVLSNQKIRKLLRL